MVYIEMAKTLKLVTVVGTRPEIIRLSCLIRKLDNSEAFDHILVHTGQNYDYELNEVFFEDLEIRKPDYFLEAAGQSPMSTIGQVLIKIDPILEKTKPEAMLILGDTNSSLCAIAAKRRKIPIFHMEAGNRCYDQRVPEEINRVMVDHISDINLTYSTIAREYLLREGIRAESIIKTGSPMREVLNYYSASIDDSKILESYKLEKGKYFVLSVHREENLEPDDQFRRITVIINSLCTKYNLPVFFSVHPRTRKKMESLKIVLPDNVIMAKPLGFSDYVHLQLNSFAVLSDSGTISEESSILNFPAINLREAHERPEGMEEAAVMMTGLNKDRVFQALEILKSQRTVTTERVINEVQDYKSENVSEKVLRIILSYTDFVNRTVWKIH